MKKTRWPLDRRNLVMKSIALEAFKGPVVGKTEVLLFSFCFFFLFWLVGWFLCLVGFLVSSFRCVFVFFFLIGLLID